MAAIVVHGLEATGKSSVLTDALKAMDISHAIIRCGECITGRHLLECTVAACLEAVTESTDQEINRSPSSRCENLNALCVHLQRLLEGRERFVLVFDGIDRQREAPSALLPALARLNEMVGIPTFYKRETHLLIIYADTECYSRIRCDLSPPTLPPEDGRTTRPLLIVHTRGGPAYRVQESSVYLR